MRTNACSTLPGPANSARQRRWQAPLPRRSSHGLQRPSPQPHLLHHEWRLWVAPLPWPHAKRAGSSLQGAGERRDDHSVRPEGRPQAADVLAQRQRLRRWAGGEEYTQGTAQEVGDWRREGGGWGPGAASGNRRGAACRVLALAPDARAGTRVPGRCQAQAASGCPACLILVPHSPLKALRFAAMADKAQVSPALEPRGRLPTQKTCAPGATTPAPAPSPLPSGGHPQTPSSCTLQGSAGQAKLECGRPPAAQPPRSAATHRAMHPVQGAGRPRCQAGSAGRHPRSWSFWPATLWNPRPCRIRWTTCREGKGPGHLRLCTHMLTA